MFWVWIKKTKKNLWFEVIKTNYLTKFLFLKCQSFRVFFMTKFLGNKNRLLILNRHPSSSYKNFVQYCDPFRGCLCLNLSYYESVILYCPGTVLTILNASYNLSCIIARGNMAFSACPAQSSMMELLTPQPCALPYFWAYSQSMPLSSKL